MSPSYSAMVRCRNYRQFHGHVRESRTLLRTHMSGFPNVHLLFMMQFVSYIKFTMVKGYKTWLVISHLLSANLGSPDEHVKKNIERTLRLKFSYVNEIQESGRKRSANNQYTPVFLLNNFFSKLTADWLSWMFSADLTNSCKNMKASIPFNKFIVDFEYCHTLIYIFILCAVLNVWLCKVIIQLLLSFYTKIKNGTILTELTNQLNSFEWTLGILIKIWMKNPAKSIWSHVSTINYNCSIPLLVSRSRSEVYVTKRSSTVVWCRYVTLWLEDGSKNPLLA